jgi:hypothetical protein
MSRVVNATMFFMAGFLVCPDDGWMRWQSGRCPRCRARLIGPGKRARSIDIRVRAWSIDVDGHAELLSAGEPHRAYQMMLPTKVTP